MQTMKKSAPNFGNNSAEAAAIAPEVTAADPTTAGIAVETADGVGAVNRA